jgi:hypothetical protein
MPEWHIGMEPKTPNEKFNRIHSIIRNVIERSFGVLKNEGANSIQDAQLPDVEAKKWWLLLVWSFTILFVSMVVKIRILLILIVILILSQQSRKGMYFLITWPQLLLLLLLGTTSM